jgi:hypothetical protein
MKKNTTSRVVSVFGNTHRSDPWHGGQKVRAVAVFGDVKVIVPEDAAVELTGTALFGDNRSEVTGASPTATPCESRDWPWSAT